MPEATPSDVKVELDTELADIEISPIIERVEREWKRVYSSSDFDGTQHIEDFEAALTALRIAEGRGRRASEDSIGDSDLVYEEDEITQLRKRVRRDDPGSVFGHAGTVTRDRDRNINTSDV